MSDNWLKSYSELKEYTAKNPQIDIGMNVIAIPGDVRPGFYRLFDTVRVAFLKEKYQTLLDEAEALSKNFAQTEEEVTKLLGLSEISLPASLNWFLNDPVNGLMRRLFGLLFDLLKKKIDVDTFERTASDNIEKSFTNLYHSGYEKWVVFSLTKSLAPDKIFETPIDEFDESAADSGHVPAAHEERVDEPVETTSLSFMPEELITFIVPDIIVHSASANRYVSIKSGMLMLDPVWTAKMVSDNREWYDRSSLTKDYGETVRWPDFMVYASDELEDLALVADYGRICRPDIIIECMEQKDWYQAGGLERVKLTHAMLKPKMGTYVVSLETVPEAALTEILPQPVAVEPTPEPAAGESAPEQKTAPEAASAEPEEREPAIHILTVGFDSSKLAPIIDALLPGKEAAGETEGQ